MTTIRAACLNDASALDRRFEALVFDWDGTAVPDRSSDASEVRALIEALCVDGMHLAVVTGTHVGNVDGQLGARPTGPGRLLFAVNRGSEVFEVDGEGPRLVSRRDSTDAEEAALDRAAALTVERLAARGLAAEVVSQRLNRRKVDLIPLAEWADPPKAQIDQLLTAVETRLAAANLAGLSEVVALAEQAARDAGLADPRVTSDAKHVEIGLTDKSEAGRYLFAELWRHGIGPRLVLLAGDEVGPLGGLPGSDSLLLVPEFRDAITISVGVEPHGVPPGVINLGGGPSRFRDLLTDQLRRRQNRDAPDVDVSAGWHLSFDGITHEGERTVEALLTLADGTIGTSGAPLLAHPSAAPTVVAAGIYLGNGPEADLLDLPRWERLQAEGTLGAHLRRVLDLHTGVLSEQTHDGRGMRSVRFSSLARPGTAVLRVEGGPLTILPGPPLGALDEDVHTIEQPGVERSDSQPECAVLHANGGAVAVAAVQQLNANGLDRIAVYQSVAGAATAQDAIARLADARSDGFESLLAEHRRAWATRWDAADIRLDGDDKLQLAVRVALYHLMSSVADRGEAAVGARGLSGHAYRGHVFWDADVFVLPFLAATHSEAARAMLEYRVRRLSDALAVARAEGRRGARFPWESAWSGEDVTPRSVRDQTGLLVPIRTGDAELHIVADVAWAACCYTDWSGDAAFAAGAGHRILVETARYWTSRVRVEHDGTAHLYGVIGPDEYHEPVDDNMFTNVMARWNLRAAHASALVHGDVDTEERTRWLDLAEALVDGYDPATGIYEQCAGFYGLEPVLTADVAPRRPIAADLLLGRDRVRAAQIIKQPDVLMAHHLVPGELQPGSLLPNVDYYEPRTAHGSSLSPGVQAAVLARAGRLEEAVKWLRVAANVDLADVTATTAGGLHVATMGSVWQALAWGFAGLRARPDGLAIDPRLPEGWHELELQVRFRGARVRVLITPDATTIVSDRVTRVLAGAVARDCGPDGITVANVRGEEHDV